MEITLYAVGVGAVSGLVLGLAGYLKARTKQEQFDVKKFLKTGVLGAVVGALVAGTGLPEDIVLQGIANMGGIVLLENVLKWALRSNNVQIL